MLRNIKILTDACKNFGVGFHIIDDNDNYISVDVKKSSIFYKCYAPFNSDIFNAVCKKKHLTHKILKNVVRVPKTKIISYQNKIDTEKLTAEILEDFSLPIIIKPSSGMLGKNVFLCGDRSDVLNAITKIFDTTSRGFDKNLLVQEYIKTKKETRVVIFNEEIIFAYTKKYSSPKFINGRSEIFQDQEIPEIIDDKILLKKISDFFQPIYKVLPFEYTGADLILDESDNLVLIELNTQVGLGFFMKHCGEEKVKLLYEKMIQYLLKK